MSLSWVSGLVVLASSILLGFIVIPFMRRLNAGQFIRQEGPQSHLVKAGTPTMGGIIFIVPWLIGILYLRGLEPESIALIFATLFFGLIGFIDDYIKVVLKRNLGLKASQKIIGQLIGSALLITIIGLDQTEVYIPFLNVYHDFGWTYYPFALFFIVAVTNSVNLTDGLDGLASSVTVVFLTVMALLASLLPMESILTSNMVLALSLVGFLMFNRYPAKVFMGDMGSLALGGYVAAMVMILKGHFLFLIIGIIYVIEAISVVLQVFWFKRTGERLFRMAPIHHHFELMGWNEVKIVSIFAGITGVFGLLGYWMMR